MISFEKALETILNSARQLDAERVHIGRGLNRILAQDVKADRDMPPFNKSAMDGYACRREDLGAELAMVETIPAGVWPKEEIGPRQCAKIMTGGVVPRGADCVIMREYVETVREDAVRFVGEQTADNICLKGQDVKAGDIILWKGTRLRAQQIAVLASVGCVKPMVAKRPRVGVIATGNELVEPAAKPWPSQIRNSNSFQLAAQVEQVGAVSKNYGAAADRMEAIHGAFKQACGKNDVVLMSGGVSAGDYDLVKAVLEANGVKLLFEKVAVNPGRPMVFGVGKKVSCFGLPGNPVSAFVLFELLVKPSLYKMMGHDFRPAVSCGRLAKTITTRRAEQDSWLPVVLTEDDRVRPVEYHGSAHISALCVADGLLCVPAGVARIEEGTEVAVRQI